MNQRFLIGIIILAGIGSISSVMAFSGTISAGQGNFNNVLVTGTCTGCGEGSFTTYSLDFNGTVTGSDGSAIKNLQIGSDGSLIAYTGGSNATVINPSHTVIGFGGLDSGTNTGPYQYGQSVNGEYKVITTDSGGTHKIQIFKNNVLLQTKTIDVTQFFGGNLASCAISISNSGQYIIVYGPDASVFSLDREIVIKGS